MTKDTLYILIATMMNMNASANQNEIVNTHTVEDAKRLVWSTYGMHPTKQQIEEELIKMIWHTRNSVWLNVGGVDGLSNALAEKENLEYVNYTPKSTMIKQGSPNPISGNTKDEHGSNHCAFSVKP